MEANPRTSIKPTGMFYKNFRFNVFIRVAGIVVLTLLLAIIVASQARLFVPLATSLALIAAVVNLIYYIEKSNKSLTHFLLSIRQGAYTDSFTSGNRGRPHELLSSAMNEVVLEFAKLNEERELHYQYLQALNENIGIAVLSFDIDGSLRMMNTAAKKLLNTPTLTRIEQFREIDPALYEAIKNIRPEQRLVTKVFISGELYQLSVQVKEILLQRKHVRIILLQNLNNELEEKEIEAWHDLMRVLTHEIMNSVTPIVSLSDAIRKILLQPDGSKRDLSKLDPENAEDIFNSITTISSRSRGLLKFVNTYRDYSRTPEPTFEYTDVILLVNRVVDLHSPELQKSHVQCIVHASEESISTLTDVSLMEQVVINILKNALEAAPQDGTGKIEIDIMRKPNNNVHISIADNGIGMDTETLSRIFIPFFTTKSKGSGIGLSLSRQVMKLHNGSIKVHSQPGQGSIFSIEWP